MKRLIPALLLVSLAGCTVEVQSGDHSQPIPATQPNELTVWIDNADNLSVEGWKISESDLPTVYRQRQADKVIIRGNPGADFSKAVEVESSLKAAGIDNVVIGKISGWQ